MGKHTSGRRPAVWPRGGCFGAEGVPESAGGGGTQPGGEAAVGRWRRRGAVSFQPSGKRVMETRETWEERQRREHHVCLMEQAVQHTAPVVNFNEIQANFIKLHIYISLYRYRYRYAV